MRKLIAGNWKMHGLRGDLAQVHAVAEALGNANEPLAADVLICPPATLLGLAVDAAQGTPLMIGGQDCHAVSDGQFTGEISAEMLADMGCSHVIIGHSERRAQHGETDRVAAEKALAAARAGLVPIICIGERLEDRKSGQALRTLAAQLEGSLPEELRGGNFVLAYEPVWAIGTGVPAENHQIAEVHAMLRERLVELCGPRGEDIAILYGGSMKPDNAADIFGLDHVGGGLIGGASLKAESFLAILAAA